MIHLATDISMAYSNKKEHFYYTVFYTKKKKNMVDAVEFKQKKK